MGSTIAKEQKLDPTTNFVEMQERRAPNSDAGVRETKGDNGLREEPSEQQNNEDEDCNSGTDKETWDDNTTPFGTSVTYHTNTNVTSPSLSSAAICREVRQSALIKQVVKAKPSPAPKGGPPCCSVPVPSTRWAASGASPPLKTSFVCRYQDKLTNAHVRTCAT